MNRYKISEEAYKRFRPFMIGFWLIQSIFLFGLSTLASRIILPGQDPVALYYFGQYFVQWGIWIAFTLFLFRKTIINYDPAKVWKPLWFLMHTGIFLTVLLLTFLAEYIYRLIVGISGIGPPIELAELAGMYLLQTGTFLMKYFFIVGFSQAICYLYYIKEKEVEKEKIEKDHNRLQYQFLSMQIKPHFIFNSLHTIHSLIEEADNKRASLMLMKLSTLMRNMINYSERDTITLAEETENLKNYIALQQIRFGDEISVQFDLSPATSQVPLPALTLQPLVENCFQHAFSERIHGNISVSSRLEGQEVIICVADNGRGFGLDKISKESYGLKNIRERLFNLYGGNTRMEIKPASPTGTMVEIHLSQTYMLTHKLT